MFVSSSTTHLSSGCCEQAGSRQVFFGCGLGTQPQLRRALHRNLSLEVSAAKAYGPGKKWEHYELTKNGKPVRIPMHVVRGDTVIVIAGKDRNKVGKVTQTLYKTGQVLVEGVNIKNSTVQPKNKSETGQILLKEFPVHHSNVMHYSEKEKVRSRLGRRVGEDGKKVRYLVKTGEVLPNSRPEKAQA